MKFSMLLMGSICLVHLSFGQSDSTSDNKTRFKLGMNYSSTLQYYGRTDSLKSTGVFPMAELWFNKEFYVNAAPVFVSNNGSKLAYAGTVTTLGWLHLTEKWITSIYVMKPFYRQSSDLVQSALEAQGSASFTYQNKFLNITAGGDAKYSDKLDFGATAGLDHMVKKQVGQGVIVIDPSVYLYAGTQNFTNNYYKKKQGLLLLPGGTETGTKQVQEFNILAYECSLPLIYARGNWMAMATPSYIIPQNLVKVEGRPDLSEQGQPLFYVNLGIKRTF